MPLLGTSVQAIDLAEDRGRFGARSSSSGCMPRRTRRLSTPQHALEQAESRRLPAAGPAFLRTGRPGDADRLLHARDSRAYLRRARGGRSRAGEIFLDRFLEDSVEVDVDALCDGAAGPGSAGSCSTSRRPACTPVTARCVLPPHSLGEEMLEQIRERDARHRAGDRRRRPDQRAVRDPRVSQLFVIEANPRASRTVPFVSQGRRAAARQARLPDHARREPRRARAAAEAHRESATASTYRSRRPCCRSTVSRAPDALLGPEMRSTGEVMGIARDFPTAFAKAQAAAGSPLPTQRHGVHPR